MPAPTFVQEAETLWGNSTTPKTTASFSTVSGDVLVALLGLESWNGTQNPSVAVSGGPTWAGVSAGSIAVLDYCWAHIYAATAAGGSVTATLTKTQTGGTALFFGGNVLTFRGSDGIGASAKTNVSGAAPSLNITTTQDNSAIVVLSLDWNALTTSLTWRTVNGITPTSGNGLEVTYDTGGGNYTVYAAYYSDAGAAGSKTVGLSAPAGQKFSIMAVEVKGSASSGTAPRLLAATGVGR